MRADIYIGAAGADNILELYQDTGKIIKTKEKGNRTMALKENVGAFAVKQALSYMDKDPEKNLPKLLDWFDKLDRKDTLKTQREVVRKVVMDKDNNWHQLMMSLWTDIDPGVRNRIFENFVINGALLGSQKQEENRKKYNCNIPWAILLDPTSACNLKCTGCWAAEYGNHMNLTYEETSGTEEGHHPSLRCPFGLCVLYIYKRNFDR